MVPKMESERGADLPVRPELHDGQGLTSEFIPYGVGCIESYFREHARSRDQFDVVLFQDPERFIERFLEDPPAVVAFSNYSWNRELSYALARCAKRRHPETLVVFAGPNYPLEDPLRERWLQQFEAVDVYVLGEGEQPFSELIDHWAEVRDIDKTRRAGIEGCHALVDGRLFKSNDVTPRLPSLDLFESPYTAGFLDEFLASPRLIPLTETNRGCPFQCTFCEKGVSAWTKLTKRSISRFEEELRYIAQRTPSSFLILSDNNFGMLKEDLEAARALTRTYREFGYPLQIHAATSKSRYDRVVEAVKILEGRLPVTVAVQSLDEEVLHNIKRRNLPLENLLEVTGERYSGDTRSRSELILGLPGDSRDKHIDSLCTLVDAGVSFIVDYTLILLDGSEMSTTESREKFDMRTMFRLNHRCFGNYPFGDQELCAAEIEEVVVGLNTLSFPDYLDCRMFYFTIGVFYLDEIVFELFEFLRSFDIERSQFVRYVHEHGRRFFTPDLEALYRSFEQATRNELWSSRDELES
jgi:radical SAM superfamily enzyme YgiQ (UPF0313 family)